jgi:topoisomerase IA-like protein
VSRDISIRKGRFGPYIYYQTPEMDTPKFISIGKDFRDGFLTCEPTLIIDYVWQKLAEPPTPPRGKK